MALNERYVLSAPLETYLVDKDSGLPLANGTLTFYRDTARNTPKAVYQLSGTPPNYSYTALPNPIELSAVGTVQDAGGDNVVIYYYPYDEDGNLDLYYVVAKDVNGVEQFTREAWPNVTAGNDPTQSQIAVSNQISNPQFSEVFINTSSGQTTVYSVSASAGESFALAPNWDIVLVGTGSATVQRIAITGNQHVPTSPPYVLDIDITGGLTACYLRQRFNVNTGLWATTTTDSGDETISIPVYLSGAITGRAVTGSNVGLSITYVPSYFTSLDTPIQILSTSLQDADFQYASGATANAIPLSSDSSSEANGYIDIRVNLAVGSHVQISGIQVVPTNGNNDGGNVLAYDLQSTNRETAYLGDYYIPRAVAKAIPSLLTGWDFPLNPAQFSLTGNIGGTAAYVWDQTIAARGSSGAVAYARNAVTGGLELTTAGSNDAFYILQYLTGAQAKKILGTKLAVNVFGYKGVAGDDVTLRVYLYRGSSSATIPSLGSTIGTLSSDGTFTLTAANWTLIPRGGLNTATTVLNTITDTGTPDWSTINSPDNDYGFSQWEIIDSAQIADTDKFAIVVTFGYIDASTIITINSISVVPGDLPCRPALQTANEVLIDCEYYYQKSFKPGLIPAQNVGLNNGEVYCVSSVDNSTNYGPFVEFPVPLRANPTMVFYNPAAANAQIRNVTSSLNFSNTAVVGTASPTSFAVQGTVNAAIVIGQLLAVNYTADARLGLV